MQHLNTNMTEKWAHITAVSVSTKLQITKEVSIKQQWNISVKGLARILEIKGISKFMCTFLCVHSRALS